MSENALIPRPAWSLDAPLDQKAAFAVCEAVAFGRELKDIERDQAMPPRDLFISWVMRDASLALTFNRAREMSAYVMEDDALALLRESLGKKSDSTEVRKLDLYVQQLRWSAAKRNPSVYSEKSNVNVTVPIQINTSLDMGKGEISVGTKEYPNIYEYRAVVAREVENPADPETPRLGKAGGRRRFKWERGFGPQKRVLVPKERLAETAVEREARLMAEKLAQERRHNRKMVVEREMKRKRAKREARAFEDGSPEQEANIARLS